MRYLIAPNAFKGTIPAYEAANLIAGEVLKKANAECLIQPIADGGDGTCSLLIDSLGLEKIEVVTLNAVGQPTEGFIGWDALRKTAYLDISTASCIGMLEKHQKDPETTSTYGTGLLIQKAIQIGATEIVMGLGGSATVDLGTGILCALGVLFLDENGREIPLYSPGFLKRINHIQRTAEIPKIRFTCLCDVRNPFLGLNGAVQVFGPQKGIELDQLEPFEKSCEKVLGLLIKKSKKEWTDQAGFGAAGGVAMGLQFFFQTEIKFGSRYFFDLVKIEEKVRQSDWIITGEGRYDSQSDQGKASFELLNLAMTNQKKIALITSGQDAKVAGFDLILELPALDFSSLDFKEIARENLRHLLKMAILEGRLD